MEKILKLEIDKSIEKIGLDTNLSLSFLYSNFRKNNACEYCLLRSLHIYKQEFFNLGLFELKSILNTLSLKLGEYNVVDLQSLPCNPTNNEESVELYYIKCRFCYNILDNDNIRSYIINVLNSSKVENYDNNKLEISLLFSLNLTMMDYLLKIFFQKITNTDSVNITELKTIVRFKIIHQMNSFTELVYSQGSRLEVSISIDQLEHSNNYLKLLTFKSQTGSNNKNKSKQVVNIKWNKYKLIEYLSNMTLEDLGRLGIYPPPVNYSSKPYITSLTWTHKPVYLAGRYLKLDRVTSQTPFFVGSRKLCEHSVSDSFEPVLSQFEASSYTMVPSGREDMDVRMLGSGRPFYLEVKNPKITNMDTVNFKNLQTLINKVHRPVEIRELCSIEPDQTQLIKLGEESKTKYYRALIWCTKSRSELNLDAINQLPSTLADLQQGTPIRVSHRRAAGNRLKKIYNIKVTPLDDNFIQADIHTQAGTYIKELVHGDSGRTQPNISSVLGCVCELLELDVIHVDLNWPQTRRNVKLKKL